MKKCRHCGDDYMLYLTSPNLPCRVEPRGEHLWQEVDEPTTQADQTQTPPRTATKLDESGNNAEYTPQVAAPLPTQPNETVVDSCLDLANYAIFTAMFAHGECDFTDDAAFFTHFDDVLVALRNIVVERRKKYGPGNLVIHGARGTVVRASDKISRLNHHYFPPSQE